MLSIISFLKEKFLTQSKQIEQIEQITFSSQELEKVNHLFKKASTEINQSRNLSLKPRLQKNQIWSLKNEYCDFLGEKITTDHPLIVIINSEPDEFEGEDFARVNVISPFIEFATSIDLVCQDNSIIGFPFLVETWNDQPILTEILDKYLGYFEVDLSFYQKKNYYEMTAENIDDYFISKGKVNLNHYQREFRELEVSKAKFINRSVLALLSFLENRQTLDTGVVISLLNRSDFPQFYIGKRLEKPQYALAVKTGFDLEDKYLKFEDPKIPFQVFIRRNESGFIITVMPNYNIKIFNSEKIEIKGVQNKDKAVFSNLKKGLYSIISNNIQEPLIIRIK